MRDVQQTVEFSRWLGGLRDVVARARIAARVQRLTLGNFGDAKALGGGLHELRIDHGPGFRVYFVNRDGSVERRLAPSGVNCRS